MNTLMWFRQDLRLKDNPALAQAIAKKNPVLFLYILEEDSEVRPLGSASKWWLHHSLQSLEKSLSIRGAQLIFLRGIVKDILPLFIKEHQISAVYWNRLYEPYHIKRDLTLKKTLQQQGLSVHTCNSALLREPFYVRNKQNESYKVFTPFFKSAYLGHEEQFDFYEQNPPAHFNAMNASSDHLNDWQLCPTSPNWAKNFPSYWQPGEEGAEIKLNHFLIHSEEDYELARNFPAKTSTTQLSPHLHFGEISPWRIWKSIRNLPINSPSHSSHCLLSQLAWREFSYHLLYHYPTLHQDNWRKSFDHFPWVQDEKALRSWQRGMTGFPIVDAGMRELYATGWMHNRVRMIVASFLIKDLMSNWRNGEHWFWDTLVDADLANNAASWQWVAGSGADAAPYFRIFNPSLQSIKFDPEGTYIKKWIPELKPLNSKEIHSPDKYLSTEKIKKMGYINPIVDHQIARNNALSAFKNLK